MKIYIWKNSRTESDLEIPNEARYGEEHSGALVICAESIKRAIEMATDYDIEGNPLEVDFTTLEECVLINANGEC